MYVPYSWTENTSKKTRVDSWKLSANYLSAEASFKCQDFFRLLIVPQYLKNNKAWCWLLTFLPNLLMWCFWKHNERILGQNIWVEQWESNQWIINSRQQEWQYLKVMMRILHNHLFTFTWLSWAQVEFLLHPLWTESPVFPFWPVKPHFIFKDFLKNAEKMHLKKTSDLTNSSLFSSKHFVYCECHTLRKLQSEFYLCLINKKSCLEHKKGMIALP